MTTSSDWELRLFPVPTDPEIRQHAVDLAVSRLITLPKIATTDVHAERTRLQVIIHLNKDDSA